MLGVGYLGGEFGAPAEAASLLDEATAAGVADVVVIRANELIIAGDTSGGLDLPHEAAASGNLSADFRLIEIYRELLTVNVNAYTYLTQAQLAQLELYSGTKSGTLSRPTIQAIYRYCAQRAVEQLCRLGPLSSQTARVLAGAF